MGDSTLPVSINLPKRVGTDTNWQKVFALNSNLYTSTGSIKGEIAGLEAYTASLKGAAIVSSSQQITEYNTFAVTSSANTFYGNQTISGSLRVSGNLQFNGAQYSSLQTLSGSANVSQSVYFDTTGPQFGVSLVDNTKLTVTNSGTYNIQFSAQLLADTGADNTHIWFKKNGTNVAGSATQIALANNEENVVTVNILDTAVASDYYEIAWQNTNGDAVLLYEAATGNIPSVPSVITTITQVR